jgi:hypothetical protein
MRDTQRMPEPQPAWSFEHSVECDAASEFAWAYWTDVENWKLDADVESIEIDGTFTAGTRGRTHSKSSGVLEWRIAEAADGRAVIEFPLEGAVGRFYWTFIDAGGRSRITQRCVLEGERAASYAAAVAQALEAGIPAGMRKLADTIEAAAGRKG